MNFPLTILFLITFILMDISAAEKITLRPPSQEEVVQKHFARWEAEVMSIKLGLKEHELMEQFRQVTRDTGVFHYGGSGLHTRLILLDDFVQLEALFDTEGKLLQRPRVEKAKRWLKSPEGHVHLLDR